MGSVGSLCEVSNYKSKGGAVVDAGLATILESDNTVSKDTSEGQLVGISLGKDLSDIGRTVVCHKGLRVPIQLKSSFNPTIGAQVAIEDDTGLARLTPARATVMSMRSCNRTLGRLGRNRRHCRRCGNRYRHRWRCAYRLSGRSVNDANQS